MHLLYANRSSIAQHACGLHAIPFSHHYDLGTLQKQKFKHGLSNVSCLWLLTCHLPPDACFVTITSPFIACYKSNRRAKRAFCSHCHVLSFVTDSSSLLLQRLKEEGKVWCIHNASEKDDVLFPKDATPLITLTQDLVDFWHATKVRLASQALLAKADSA